MLQRVRTGIATAMCASILIAAIGAPGPALATPGHPAASGVAAGGSAVVSVGANPVELAINRANHSVYVTNGAEGTVSVIDARACNAHRHGGCSQTPPTVTVGNFPLGVAVDPATSSIYVASLDDGIVSVIDGRHCRGGDASGCGQTPASVTVGDHPTIVTFAGTTPTVYVANAGDEVNPSTVSVIDTRHCNASDTSGCGQTPASIAVGVGPGGMALDPSTNTLYVANFDDGTVSVVDTSKCNGADTSGCAQTPPTVAVGRGPSESVFDPSTHTVYVPVGSEYGDRAGSLAMIDAAICNATDVSGCAQAPLHAPVGTGPTHATLDGPSHTVYVSNQGDSTISAIDDSVCNAKDDAGCRRRPPALSTGFDPASVEVNPGNHTLYATSQETNSVWVLNGARCDAGHSSGCARFAPTTDVGLSPGGMAVNADTQTLYVANRDDGTVSVVDAAACNASHLRGCRHTWATVTTGGAPPILALNRTTNTIYTANGFFGDNTVSVIDGRHCNGGDTSGCEQSPATVMAGNGAFAAAVDERTNTIYVANRDDGTVSVIDGRHCNGADTSGCGAIPPTVTVGASPQALAVDASTRTVYVANTDDGTVSVIDGRHCRAGDVSNCGQVAPTVTVGAAPRAVGLNGATHSIYVANRDDGTVSVVDGRHCKGSDASNCGQTPPTVAVGGFTGRGVAVDTVNNVIYVTSIWDSDVVAIDGATCRAGHASHCVASPLPLRTGGWPTNVALSPGTNTIYVPDNDDAMVSVYRTLDP